MLTKFKELIIFWAGKFFTKFPGISREFPGKVREFPFPGNEIVREIGSPNSDRIEQLTAPSKN